MASPTWFLTNAIKGVFGVDVPPATSGAPRCSPLRRRPLFEAMEQRLLLSADPLGELGAPTDPVDTSEPVVSAPLAEVAGSETAAPPVISALPVAVSDDYVVSEDSVLSSDADHGVLANDTGDSPLRAALESGPSNAERFELRPDGSFDYQPVQNYSGLDSFTYHVVDGQEVASGAVTVLITIEAVPDAPIAYGGEYDVAQDGELPILFKNLASDGDGDTLQFEVTSPPPNGTLTSNQDGFVYIPNTGYVGPDSFTYTVDDMTSPPAAATVTITVGQVANAAPEFTSEPVTEFTIDADACGFDGDGVFRVAGAPEETVQVELCWTFREALYNNEFGIYRVSDQDGRVGDLLPGAAGYAQAALAAGNAQVVFASGASAGAHATLDLKGGALYAFYIIQNSSTASFLASNPDNELDGRPLAFFSIASANPDKFDHVHAGVEAGLLKLRWEDLTGGGDADYDDVVMSVAGLAASSNDVVYRYHADAEDADGDPLTYRLADGPKGAYIDSHTGVLSWAAAPGVFHFVIEADDGRGGVKEQAFDLTVETRSTDLVIQGTGGKDRIEVSERNGLVTVRLNDVARTYCHVSSLRVEALGGDDTVSLRGLTMCTTVDGGDGNDYVDASAVTKRGVVLHGGAGNDRLTGGAGDDRMDGGTGDDQLWGGCGNDLLVGDQGKDCLYGGDGNDLLDGGADSDQLRGGNGNDLLIADGGDDYLKGEDGNDILVGGAGNDSSQGNYGADLLIDGPGCDSNGWISCQDTLVDGAEYDIPTTLPAQPPGPVIDWSSRYEALVDSLQQFCDHPSNPQWWEDFVTNLGQTDAQSNPNSQIRVVIPGTGV